MSDPKEDKDEDWYKEDDHYGSSRSKDEKDEEKINDWGIW